MNKEKMQLNTLLVLNSQIGLTSVFRKKHKNHKYEIRLSLQYIRFCSLSIEPYWNIVH